MTDISSLWVRNLIILRCQFSTPIYRVKTIPFKILTKIVWALTTRFNQGLRIGETIWTRNNEVGGFTPPDLKPYCKTVRWRVLGQG